MTTNQKSSLENDSKLEMPRELSAKVHLKAGKQNWQIANCRQLKLFV
jgi:hypothetical protein